MDQQRTSEACKMGDLVTRFVDRLSPACSRYDSLAHAWDGLLPETLRAHSRIAGVSNGCLKVVTDGSSYLFELQLCKAVLLRELQRLCPSAQVRRIELGMAR